MLEKEKRKFLACCMLETENIELSKTELFLTDARKKNGRGVSPSCAIKIHLQYTALEGMTRAQEACHSGGNRKVDEGHKHPHKAWGALWCRKSGVFSGDNIPKNINPACRKFKRQTVTYGTIFQRLSQLLIFVLMQSSVWPLLCLSGALPHASELPKAPNHPTCCPNSNRALWKRFSFQNFKRAYCWEKETVLLFCLQEVNLSAFMSRDNRCIVVAQGISDKMKLGGGGDMSSEDTQSMNGNVWWAQCHHKRVSYRDGKSVTVRHAVGTLSKGSSPQHCTPGSTYLKKWNSISSGSAPSSSTKKARSS